MQKSTGLRCNLELYKIVEVTVDKESGRVRRRLGRNVGPQKRLKKYRWFEPIFECYSFNSILDYWKMGKSFLQCILFLQNMILNMATWPISYKIDKFRSVLPEFYCSGSSLQQNGFNVLLNVIFRMHCKILFNFTVRHDLQKLSNKMIAHWYKKLDPYWSIEDMMNFHTLAAVNNLNTECYVIQSKK